MKRNLAFALFSLFGACLLQVNNLHASESLEDGILWSTKAEINERFGKPSYLYCEEEPFRRYMIVKPEDENSLRATFLYDVTIHDFYYLNKMAVISSIDFIMAKICLMGKNFPG